MLADWFNDAISPLEILQMSPVRLEVVRALATARKRRVDAQEKRAAAAAKAGR